MAVPGVVDSGVWIAAFNKKDAHHQRGREIVAAISAGGTSQAIITDHIFNEVVTYTRKKLGSDASVKIASALLDSNHVKLIVVDEAIFTASYHMFEKYDTFSFTDASIVVVMKQLKLRWLYSFDAGFDRVDGITRLEGIPAR